MSLSRFAVVSGALAVWALAPVSVAVAQTSGSGINAMVPQESETVQLADGTSIQRSTASGYVLTTDPRSPLNANNEVCTGTIRLGGDGTAMASGGYCHGIDPEGDMWWLWWTGGDQGGNWGFTGGTGKFRGITGGGTWSYGPNWPDGKYINRWEGSWQMTR